MPRPAPTSGDLRERKKRALEWKLFRKNNLLTQKRLAGVIGVSRRTIQQIEGAHVTPNPQTLRNFTTLKNKYDSHADIA